MAKWAWLLPRSDKRNGYFYVSLGWDFIADGEGQYAYGGGINANEDDNSEYEEAWMETLNIGKNGAMTSIYNTGRLSAGPNCGNPEVRFYINGWLGNFLYCGGACKDGAWHWQATTNSTSKSQSDIDGFYTRFQAQGQASKESVNFDSFANKMTFTPGYVGVIRPDADKTTNWSVTGAATHYGAVDDDVIQPTAGDTSDYIHTNASSTIDEIYFSSILGVSNVSRIKVWLYAKESNTSAANCDVDVYCGALLGSKSTAWTTSWAWYSYEWTGLSKSQSDLDGLYIKLTSGNNLAGAYIQSIAAIYIEVTYEPNMVADRLNNIIGQAACATTSRVCRPQYWKCLKFNGIDKREMAWNGCHVV